MRKVFVMLLLWSVSCLAQTIPNSEMLLSQTITAPMLGATRSMTMGGVFTATNAGIESITGNPAGLVHCEGSQVMASGRLRMSGEEVADDEYYDAVGLQDYSKKFKPGFKGTNLGVAFPVSVSDYGTRIVGAIGYRSYYDMSFKKEEEFETTATGNKYNSTYEQTGLLNVMTFAAGFQVNEQFSLGVVYNLPMFSDYESESKQEVDYTNLTTSQTYKESAKVTGNGFLHLGAMFNVSPELVLGATYTFAHKYELKDGEWTAINDNGGGDPHTSTGDYKNLKFEAPSYWSLGASYMVSPNLMVAADLQNRPWKDFEINNYDMSEITENGTTWRIGAELGQDAKFRVGYFSDVTPMLDANKDAVRQTGISGGLGLVAGALNVDLGLVFKRMEYEIGYTNESGPELIKENYHVNELLICATMSYGFDFVLGGN